MKNTHQRIHNVIQEEYYIYIIYIRDYSVVKSMIDIIKLSVINH